MSKRAGRSSAADRISGSTGLRIAVFLCLLLLGCTAAPPREVEEEAGPVSPPRQDAPSALELRFLDVGQGDAVLLRSDGRTALIDAGGSDRIVQQLRALDVDSIDLLVASHNHADHIGGMDAVLDSFPVRFYLDNGHPATTRIQERVLQRVERMGVTYLAAASRTLSLGETRLRVLPAPGDVAGDEQNNRSVSVVVERGDFRALLTGDSEVELLNALLAGDFLPDVDVLKAAHHGSRNGVTPAWLARTRPEVVVISVGGSNTYGHPHAAALRYYCAGGRGVYRTDRHGAVTVEVDSAGDYAVRVARTAALSSAGEPDTCAGVR